MHIRTETLKADLDSRNFAYDYRARLASAFFFSMSHDFTTHHVGRVNYTTTFVRDILDVVSENLRVWVVDVTTYASRAP